MNAKSDHTRPQPYGELGLASTSTGGFSPDPAGPPTAGHVLVMWSEHCSYKSSKVPCATGTTSRRCASGHAGRHRRERRRVVDTATAGRLPSRWSHTQPPVSTSSPTRARPPGGAVSSRHMGARPVAVRWTSFRAWRRRRPRYRRHASPAHLAMAQPRGLANAGRDRASDPAPRGTKNEPRLAVPSCRRRRIRQHPEGRTK